MLSIKEITLTDDISWDEVIKESDTATFFQTKEWLTLWVKHFKGQPKILAIYGDNKLIGIAPFDETNSKINFLGVNPILRGQLISDFGDVIIKSGRESEVWEAVLSHIKKDSRQAVMTIELHYIREESPSFEILKNLGGQIEEMEVSPIIDLPKTWDTYLSTLDRHDRHELRRKMRKGQEAAVAMLDYQGDATLIEELFKLMIAGNEQKRNFLTEKMKNFFREMIIIFWKKRSLDLTFLKLDNKLIGAVLTFLFKDELLLYNSGLNPDFYQLSAGLILKATLIKRAIENGKKRFDFLRGEERYKYDLGGKERKLYKIIL